MLFYFLFNCRQCFLGTIQTWQSLKATSFEGNILVKKSDRLVSTECGVQLDIGTRCFVDFIVHELFTIEKLKKFPDTWDCEMKGNYLLLDDSLDIKNKFYKENYTQF